MSISFNFAIVVSLRSPVMQSIVLEELSSLSQLKGGWDPSKGALPNAVKKGRARDLKPKLTDPKVLFVLDRTTGMRGTVVVTTLVLLLAGRYYCVTFVMTDPGAASSKKMFKQTRQVESVKMISPGRAYNITFAALGDQKIRIAENAEAGARMTAALLQREGTVGAPIEDDAALVYNDTPSADQLGRGPSGGGELYTMSDGELYIL